MPSASAYEFTGHCVQGPPFAPEKPRLHRQSIFASLPSGDCECSGQLAQVSASTAPSAVEYVSAAHATHVPAESAPTAVERSRE
jgi:hypothetical protein